MLSHRLLIASALVGLSALTVGCDEEPDQPLHIAAEAAMSVPSKGKFPLKRGTFDGYEVVFFEKVTDDKTNCLINGDQLTANIYNPTSPEGLTNFQLSANPIQDLDNSISLEALVASGGGVFHQKGEVCNATIIIKPHYEDPNNIEKASEKHSSDSYRDVEIGFSKCQLSSEDGSPGEISAKVEFNACSVE